MNFTCKGCWVWRGQEHPQELKDVPSYEYHIYEKLDSTKEEHRLIVQDYWTNLEEGKVVQGLTAQNVKYFK